MVLMENAVSEFLEYDKGMEKTAGLPAGSTKALGTKALGRLDRLGRTMEGGLYQAGGAAVIGLGLGLGQKAIQGAWNAINRSRGFKKMMAVHPDLAERDDQQVKGMYNLLHKTAPTMAMNPHVAGGFIRRTEHASQYVDPKMVADLADAESKIQRTAWGGIGEPIKMVAGMMPKARLDLGGPADSDGPHTRP